MLTFQERVLCGNPLQRFGSGLEPDPQPTREFGPVANTTGDGLFHCRSHCTHQLHMVRCFIPPPPMVLLRYNRRFSIPIGAPQSGLAVRYFIQRSILYFCQRSSSRMGAFLPQLGAPLFHSRLFTSFLFGNAQHRWAAPLDMCFLAWICTPQFHSTLLHHHHHSPCPPCTLHQALLLSWWHTSFPRKFIMLPFKLYFDSPWANLSIPTL